MVALSPERGKPGDLSLEERGRRVNVVTDQNAEAVAGLPDVCEVDEDEDTSLASDVQYAPLHEGEARGRGRAANPWGSPTQPPRAQRRSWRRGKSPAEAMAGAFSASRLSRAGRGCSREKRGPCEVGEGAQRRIVP